jgi:hypothetical protein
MARWRSPWCGGGWSSGPWRRPRPLQELLSRRPPPPRLSDGRGSAAAPAPALAAWVVGGAVGATALLPLVPRLRRRGTTAEGEVRRGSIPKLGNSEAAAAAGFPPPSSSSLASLRGSGKAGALLHELGAEVVGRAAPVADPCSLRSRRRPSLPALSLLGGGSNTGREKREATAGDLHGTRNSNAGSGAPRRQMADRLAATTSTFARGAVARGSCAGA